jgi:hypothetical protein
MNILSKQQWANTAPQRGIYDVHPNPDKVRRGRGGGTAARRDSVRVFTCACGTPSCVRCREVQAGSFLGSSPFLQNGVISSRLVVEPVETHHRVTPAVGQFISKDEKE